jgi:hypothetical protein
MSSAAASGKHVAAERLFKVAINSEQQLTPDEFEHLKKCLWCLERFSHFVRQNIQHTDKTGQ